MNEKHWKQFYKKDKAPKNPTSFARFCLKYIKPKSIIMDIGCGNGRDTRFFAKQNINYVVGVDPALEKDVSKIGIYFEKKNFLDYEQFNCDYVYSRFFIHSIDTFSLMRFIEKIKYPCQVLMCEFRVKGDKPKIFKDHKRNLVDSDWFLQLLINNNFEIVYSEKRRGLAKYKNEDPLVLRVIAKKK